MHEKINPLPQNRTQRNTLEQRNMNEALLDFLMTSEVDIHILNNNYETIETIKSVKDTVLGQTIMQNQSKNITGEIKEFSYVKIGTQILPINSKMVKDWAFQTAQQSNETPVLKQQITEDGEEVSYIRNNGDIKIIKDTHKKLKE